MEPSVLPSASFGAGCHLGLDYSGIDILDLGLRGRLDVVPLSVDGWGVPVGATLYAAARLHEPLEVGSIAAFAELAAGFGLAMFPCGGDYCDGAVGAALYAQGGIEVPTSPRFAMTFAVEIGGVIDASRPQLRGVLLPALVVGFRAG